MIKAFKLVKKTMQCYLHLLAKPPASLSRQTKITFLSRYQMRTDSLFLDGLVGGMFLFFLMYTGETCMFKQLQWKRKEEELSRPCWKG